MGQPIRFGLFDHLERRDAESLTALYESRLALLEMADAGPWYSYHLAEHHATPLGMAPSPNVFLAAASQRTRRIRLGSLVYLLPLYSPLRLVEEICMLDQLTDGRLDVGIGSGISPFEIGHHGIDFMQSRDIYDEALEVILKGLTHPRLDHRGKHFRYRDVPLVLQPKQQPHPPLWYGARSEASIQFAVERGINIILAGPNAVVAPLVKLHAALRQEQEKRNQLPPDSDNATPAQPFVGAFRQVLVADSDQQAERLARESYSIFYKNIMQLWMENNVVSTLIAPDYDAAVHFDVLYTGGPDTVTAQLEQYFTTTGSNYLALEVAWGSLDHEQSMRSLELLTREVLPAFEGVTISPLPESIPQG